MRCEGGTRTGGAKSAAQTIALLNDVLTGAGMTGLGQIGTAILDERPLCRGHWRLGVRIEIRQLIASDFNVGVITGKPSSIYATDADSPEA